MIPEDIKNDIEKTAIVDNLIHEHSKQLVNGLVEVPVKKIMEQILYLQNQMLPQALSKYGADNDNYRFYKGVVDSLIWTIVSYERAIYWKTEWTLQRSAVEVFRDEAIRLREQLQKYHFAEDSLLNQQDYDALMGRVKERMKDILSGKDDLRY